jgi:hypothetical protein
VSNFVRLRLTLLAPPADNNHSREVYPLPEPESGPQSTGSSRFESFGRKLDEQIGNVAPRVEEEVKKVIAYLNDEVVPEVRQSSSEALRIASEHLNRLAEHLDRGPKP